MKRWFVYSLVFFFILFYTIALSSGVACAKNTGQDGAEQQNINKIVTLPMHAAKGQGKKMGHEGKTYDLGISPFWGGTIKMIAGSLADGLVAGVEGEILGVIMDKLGWGDSSDQLEKDTLKSMNTKLSHIITLLTILEGDLATVLGQLEIDTDTIIGEINNPTTEIKLIFTWFTDLQNMALGKDVGEVPQGVLKNYALGVDSFSGSLRIPGAVDGIFQAFSPSTAGWTPVLNNYTELLMAQMNAGYGTVTDVYASLELYTSQLIINQLKGVNLVVEAKNVLAKYPDETDWDQVPAKDYFDYYNENFLKEEIDNPANGISFMANVYRLALANMDILPDDEKTFFSSEIKDFLGRAMFFRQVTKPVVPAMPGTDPPHQASGLNVLIFMTQDYDGYELLKNGVTAEHHGTGKWYRLYKHPYTSVTGFQGKVYDFWNDNYLKSSNLYDIYLYAPAPGVVMPPGIYKLWLEDDPGIVVYVSVDTYDSTYTKTDDGEINFGHASFFLTPPVNHADPDDDHWTAYHHDVHDTHTSGGAYDLPYSISGTLDYDGSIQLRHYFYFDGEDDTTVHVDFSGNVSGHVTCTEPPDNWARARIHFAVWDVTKDERASDTEGSFDFISTGGGTTNFSKTSKGTATFTAKPGHHYRTYYYLRADGYWTHNDTAVRINKVNHSYFRFDQPTPPE